MDVERKGSWKSERVLSFRFCLRGKMEIFLVFLGTMRDDDDARDMGASRVHVVQG